jgi:aminopeptidase N
MKRMFKFILILNWISAILILSIKISATEISSPTKYIPQPFDVTHYDAELDFTQYPATDMKGVCRIHVNWLESPVGNKFYFHLRDLTIDSAFYQNIKVDAVEVGTKEDSTYHFEITPPPQLSTSSATITVFYHGKMTLEYNTKTMKWGGVQSRDEILFAMGVGFYNNYVSATQHWLPCYDHPSDKASCRFKFIVPAGKEVASNGLLIEKFHPDNGTDVYVWEHKNDCATYNYTFAVSDWINLNFGNENLPMLVFCKSVDSSAVATTFKLLPKMVENYENKFGKYPFDKVGYVLTPIGSMEHETMISINHYLGKNRDTVNETAAHELAHMWFGDMVTPYDFRDAWLNESFATFCESIWYENLFSSTEYLNHQDDMRGFYISNPSGAKTEGIFPLYDFPRTPPSSNYPSTIYMKGGNVVGMLRYELGDSLFFLALQKYLSERKYKNANTDTLQYYFETVSHRSLDWFFSQWVYGKGWPQLEITFNQKPNGKTILQINQVQPDSFGVYINLPVWITFEGTNETRSIIYLLNSKQETFEDDFWFQANRLIVNKGHDVRSLLEVKSLNIVSVDEEKITNDVELIPNPANSQMLVSFTAGDGLVEIKVFNETGSIVFKDSSESKKGKNIYNLNTQELPSGQYFLVIDYNGILYHKKFIILR